MSTLRHWIWLSTRGPAPGMYAARLLEAFGSPEGAYHADTNSGLQHCRQILYHLSHQGILHVYRESPCSSNLVSI